MKDLTTLVYQLCLQGIHFKVLAGLGAEIDTTTFRGRFMLCLLAVLAEHKRELIEVGDTESSADTSNL